MESTSATIEPIETPTPNPSFVAMADKVRADSQNLNRLTHVEELGVLFPDRTPEQIIGDLAEMIKVEEYQDVRVMFSPSGAACLYSVTFITPEQATAMSIAEEAREKIADKVRQDSKERIQLTPVKSLAALFPEMELAQVNGHIDSLAAETKYADLARVTGPTDIEYLYSQEHMTHNYATILARIEAKDPYTTIAETVREESRVYPRPTRVALFYEPLFQIESGQLEMIVEGLLRRPEYADITKIVASTNAIYLYSNQHLDPSYAESWVEWEEVGRQNNP
jgi:hypothetical protein